MSTYILTKYVFGKKNIISNFDMTKIPNVSPASKFTQQKASSIRIKVEIKYLYIKKTIKNQHLLQLCLALPNSCNNCGPIFIAIPCNRTGHRGYWTNCLHTCLFCSKIFTIPKLFYTH